MDELNVIYENRAIPYEEYFGEVGLTKEQVDERIKFSNDFEDFLLMIMALIVAMKEIEYFDRAFIENQVRQGYKAMLEPYKTDGMETDDYIDQYAMDFAKTTEQGLLDPWYYSDDRAMWNAENEAFTMLGYKDFVNAVEQGYTHKRWIAFMDKKTRKAHAAVNGKEIPIMSYFEVGNARMLFPKDTFSPESNAIDHPEQTVNCRCTIRYTR